MTQKQAVRDVLHANKAHQQALKVYAERLEAELQNADKMISAVDGQDRDSDDDNSQGLVLVEGAVKPMSIVLSSALLSEDSPFYSDAAWKKRYDDIVGSVPMKAKEHDALVDAVRIENQRIFSLATQSRGEQPFNTLRDYPLSYFEQNKEGIDWERVSRKVSESIPSGATRSAKECEIRWLGYLHPDIKKDSWTAEESERLRSILSDMGGRNIDWTEISKRLGGDRVPLECMRQVLMRRSHQWNPETDKRLLDAIDIYGQHNWQLVAKTVSEDATAQQCQKRYNDTLDPSLRRGSWTAEEDTRLSRAVAAFTDTPLENLRITFGSVKLADKGIPWQDVALFVKGRNNNQCRERFQILMNPNEKGQKTAWAAEEDQKLFAIVDGFGGPGRWSEVANALGAGKTDAQCRKRYEVLSKRHEMSDQASATLPLQTVLDLGIGKVLSESSRKAKGKSRAGLSATATSGAGGNALASTSTIPTESGKPKPKPRGRPRKARTVETQGDVSHPTEVVERVAGPSSAIERLQTQSEHPTLSPSKPNARRVVLRVGGKPSTQTPLANADSISPEATSTSKSKVSQKRKRVSGNELQDMENSATRKKRRTVRPTTRGHARKQQVGSDVLVQDEVVSHDEDRLGFADTDESLTAEGERGEANTMTISEQTPAVNTAPAMLAKRKRGRPKKDRPPPNLQEPANEDVATSRLTERSECTLEGSPRIDGEESELTDIEDESEVLEPVRISRRRSKRGSKPR